jgi:hypothetical protein
MKKFKDIIKRNPEPAKGKFGINPMDPWSIKYGIAEDETNEDLRKWFKQNWVRMDTKGNIKGDCARDPGEGKPKCLPQAKAQALGKDGRAAAAQRKRREDPDPDRRGKPINVRTEENEVEEACWTGYTAKGMKKKGNRMVPNCVPEEVEQIEEKNVPTSPEKWARAKSAAKSKFAVYPSAYANGWASKKYKAMGGGWKSVSEATDKKDQVILNIPLLIRVLELARENIKTDMDLHRVVEKLIQIRNKGVLTMKDYNTIAHIKENHIAIAMGKMLDDEGSMVLGQLEQLQRACDMIRTHIGKDYEKQLPAWVQAKITLATDYVDTVGNYLVSKNEKVTEEMVNEISKKKLYDYMMKAGSKSDPKKDTKNRGMNVVKATGKYLNKEEVEQIDELNYDTVNTVASKRKANPSSKKSPEVLLKNRTASIDRFMGKIRTQNSPMQGVKRELTPQQKTLQKDYYDSQKRGMSTEGVVNELSNELLGSYKKKAGEQASAADKAGDFKTGNKRFSGIVRATKKQFANDVKEETLDELNKDTLKSYLNKSTEIRKDSKSELKDIEKRPEMYKDNTDRAQQNLATRANKLKTTITKRTTGLNRAFNKLHGVAEAADKKEMSKSARMIKSLYKKHNMKEDMTDWEKEDKSVQTYGKKPKVQTTPKESSYGENKPKAAIIMSGGKTMTGQTRDTVEIDPMLKKRPGPDDFDRNYGKKQPQ